MKLKFIIIFLIVQIIMVFAVNQISLVKKKELLSKKTQEMKRQYISINNYLVNPEKPNKPFV